MLRSHNHYVAMICDGVNDILALKQANLGIAMQSGSQATCGVADLALLYDTFASLIAIGAYLAVLIPALRVYPAPTKPYREGALPLAQTAMTVFLVLCGLLLVLFVDPKTTPGQDGRERTVTGTPLC